MGFPWTLRALVDNELRPVNAANQQFWQLFGSATDLWSNFHDDAAYFDSGGQAFMF
jgi:hypothetical protein